MPDQENQSPMAIRDLQGQQQLKAEEDVLRGQEQIEPKQPERPEQQSLMRQLWENCMAFFRQLSGNKQQMVAKDVPFNKQQDKPRATTGTSMEKNDEANAVAYCYFMQVALQKLADFCNAVQNSWKNIFPLPREIKVSELLDNMFSDVQYPKEAEVFIDRNAWTQTQKQVKDEIDNLLKEYCGIYSKSVVAVQQVVSSASIVQTKVSAVLQDFDLTLKQACPHNNPLLWIINLLKPQPHPVTSSQYKEHMTAMIRKDIDIAHHVTGAQTQQKLIDRLIDVFIGKEATEVGRGWEEYQQLNAQMERSAEKVQATAHSRIETEISKHPGMEQFLSGDRSFLQLFGNMSQQLRTDIDSNMSK